MSRFRGHPAGISRSQCCAKAGRQRRTALRTMHARCVTRARNRALARASWARRAPPMGAHPRRHCVSRTVETMASRPATLFLPLLLLITAALWCRECAAARSALSLPSLRGQAHRRGPPARGASACLGLRRRGRRCRRDKAVVRGRAVRAEQGVPLHTGEPMRSDQASGARGAARGVPA